MDNSLSTRAMIVRLSISQWTARKLDKKATKEISESHGTTEAWVRGNKTLVAEAEIKTLSKLSGDARTYHYTNTLPWDDVGGRILPAANFQQYSEKMREYRETYERATARFCAEYPKMVEDARAHLNGLYNSDDYPDANNIARKFSFDVQIFPLPEAADFRVSLADSQVDAIRKQIELTSASALNTAMRDLWDRLHNAVSHMAAKLADKEAIFRDSLVDNLRELVDLLPRLNVTNDPELDRMTEAARTLTAYSADALRNNPTTRANVAADAQAVIDAMSGYMSPMRAAA